MVSATRTEGEGVELAEKSGKLSYFPAIPYKTKIQLGALFRMELKAEPLPEGEGVLSRPPCEETNKKK